jgi:hypothetical protein
VLLIHHQEQAVLLLSAGNEEEEEDEKEDGGNPPICCIKLIVSELIHPSVILPLMMVMNPISSNDSFLPVGGIPRNSPLWVPVTLSRTATLFLSATPCLRYRDEGREMRR